MRCSPRRRQSKRDADQDEPGPASEHQRDDATRQDFRANLAMAQLGPLPERERRLRAALRFDEDATRHFSHCSAPFLIS